MKNQPTNSLFLTASFYNRYVVSSLSSMNYSKKELRELRYLYEGILQTRVSDKTWSTIRKFLKNGNLGFNKYTISLLATYKKYYPKGRFEPDQFKNLIDLYRVNLSRIPEFINGVAFKILISAWGIKMHENSIYKIFASSNLKFRIKSIYTKDSLKLVIFRLSIIQWNQIIRENDAFRFDLLSQNSESENL